MQPDYIIVGAGSAGCALANKLSEDPSCSVLLIEAGKRDAHPMIHLPGGFAKLLGDPSVMWHMPAEIQGRNEPEIWIRGKTLGGSSAVNGMVYMRGHPDDYDALGVDGWSWADLLRVYKAIEDHGLGESEWRGAGGPLRVTIPPERTALTEAIMTAFEQAGIPRVEDVNAETGECVGYQPRTIWRGRRQSAAVAFLKPIRHRSNLRIITETEVRRVLIEGRRAVGVEVRQGADIRSIRAGREIILSAGALLSPKLLQVSGVGPAPLLQRLGISVVADRPEVGRNLIEQQSFMPVFRVTRGSGNPRLRGVGLLGSVIEAYLLRSGPLTSGTFGIGALVKTRPELDRPDAQILLAPYSVEPGTNQMVPEREHGAMMVSCLLRPKGKGRIEIRSSDPDAYPLIDANYLGHEDDRRSAVGVIRVGRRILAQPALRAYGAKEVRPGPEIESDDEILAAYARNGTCGMHASGTCRMGVDEGSVVDAKLRVRGVEGLRVADLSILPAMVSGNTNAPAMAVGWHAAEIIRAG